jgi:hypothetical protein
MAEKPWWFPQLADAAYFARLRDDYPDKAGLTDADLNAYFNPNDLKYVDTWDHLGDAREQFEALADAYLALLSREDSK